MALPLNSQLRTPVIAKWFEQTNRGPSANANFLPLPGGPRAWPFASIGTSLPFRPLGQWVVGTPRVLKSPLHPPKDGGLTTDGAQTVRTGRFEITLKKGNVTVYDTKTQKRVRHPGEAEVGMTGDRVRHDLKFDLPDGSTVLLNSRQLVAKGNLYVENLAVLKGDEAVVIARGREATATLGADATRNAGSAVRDGWEQSATTAAGRPNGTRNLAASARELIGTDPTPRGYNAGLGNQGGIGQSSGILGARDNALRQRLGDTIGQLQGQLDGKMQALEEMMAQRGDDANGISDADIQRAFFEIQQLQDSIRQIVTTMTNLQKADHESRMAIARNLA